MLSLDKIRSIQQRGIPQPLSAISFSASSAILVLAPHPDDFDDVAVTVRYFHERGNPIVLVVLTGASSGVLDTFVSPPTKRNKEDVREQERRDALRFFGLPEIQVRFLRLPEDDQGELILNEHTRRIVGAIFRNISPDIISLPYGKDTNISHQPTFEVFLELAPSLGRPVLGLCH